MNDFNKERFVAYAKYDLGANRTFYRNTALAIVLVALGYMVINALIKSAIMTPYYDGGGDSFFYEKVFFSTLTAMGYWVGGCTAVELMAGCWGHSMRKKRERIGFLSLPVSSLEKYVWHTCLMVVGGTLFVTATIVAADMLGVVVSGCLAGSLDIRDSALYNTVTGIWGGVAKNQPYEIASKFHITTAATAVMFLCMALARVMVFVLSNSLLYKHNVLITYAALIILSSIFNIFEFNLMMSDAFHTQFYSIISDFDSFTGWLTWAIGASVAALCVAAALWWGGYKLFQRAEIYNRWNK